MYNFRSIMATISAPKRQNPNDFLKQIIGRPVVVKLNSGNCLVICDEERR